jgi:starch phosphorylase
MTHRHPIAYFSMEVAVDPAVPTYSGGLGILAGDTLRSAADLGVPLVGVTLLHRKGYLRQSLDSAGAQTEQPEAWDVPHTVAEVPPRVAVSVEGRTVHVRAWRYDVVGVGGAKVPVYFLDTDLPENAATDRALTDCLYGGDERYRLSQEVVLGIGGVRMLRALGYLDVGRYHMNEGHAALLGLELLEEAAAASGRSTITWADVEALRSRCVFTTHTPVPAGHDKFPMDLVRQVVGPRSFDFEWRSIVYVEGLFNLTYVALSLSQYVNGVAKRHAEVSRLMYGRREIDAITNGVHAATWTSPPFRQLFDKFVPDWRSDNFSLRYLHSIPREEIWNAHTAAKEALLREVNVRQPVSMEPGVFTIGFARRATAYKRPDLMFHDLDRLRAIAAAAPIQLVLAGKAHPRDVEGKLLIRRLFESIDRLRGQVKVVYLENYDMSLAQLITSGVDLWLNTPQPPLEASGTSGMKAALNGVPSLSVLDGWWIEGHIEGVTGWAIGANGPTNASESDRRSADAHDLYDKLERLILPLYYRDRDHYAGIMAHCIGLNASFFNTHRMVQQYVVKAHLD